MAATPRRARGPQTTAAMQCSSSSAGGAPCPPAPRPPPALPLCPPAPLTDPVEADGGGRKPGVALHPGVGVEEIQRVPHELQLLLRRPAAVGAVELGDPDRLAVPGGREWGWGRKGRRRQVDGWVGGMDMAWSRPRNAGRSRRQAPGSPLPDTQLQAKPFRQLPPRAAPHPRRCHPAFDPSNPSQKQQPKQQPTTTHLRSCLR